jgi:uncharacterized membrane protein YfcA
VDLSWELAWRYAVPMAAAAVLGGYLGARPALVIRPRHTKWLITAIDLGLAADFFSRR